MKKLISSFALVLLVTGCATPVKYSNGEMTRYDKNTEYALEETGDGFTLNLRYSRYQFIPESDAVAVACRSQATSISWEIARKRGKSLVQVNDQEVKISMGRNGVTGITSCTAQVPVRYAQGA